MGHRAFLKALLVILAAAFTLSCGNRVKDGNPTSSASTPLLVAKPGAVFGQRDVCPQTGSGQFRCLSKIVTEAQGSVLRFDTPTGYGPADLVSAYNVPLGGGTGMVIGIVDAFDDPNAESELATYRAQFGLPPCTSADGCFTKVNQRGDPSPLPPEDFGWEVEIALDLQMASAMCPNCKILLVEADFPSPEDLTASVDTAVALGANVVSNSYGGLEDPSYLNLEQHFNHPGVLITVSTGDFGTEVNYPATSQYTLAVGGTSLFQGTCANARPGGSSQDAGALFRPALDQSGRNWCETAWSGAGSGCSQFFPKPTWENDPSCPNRTVADVSAVADPSTGVAVFAQNQGGWIVVGGTSVSSPVVASIFAETGRSTVDPSFVWQHTDDFYDITSGNNGFCSISYECNAGPGYDGPTGWGTPDSALIGTAIRIDTTAATACSGSAATANVTVLGGSSGFDGDVTLSLSNVVPAPPEGGEITAIFSPNPVPAPTPAGATATLEIATTPATPSGTYTLTIQGSSPGVTQTATMTLVVQEHAPGPVTLVSPESGADGVGFNPTFTWTSSTDAGSYTLAIYSDSDCSGDALHVYPTSATSFTIPSQDALPVFATLSWQVTANNACLPAAVSACSSFRTISCAGPRDPIVNGGFEDGLAGWSVDASVPPPVVSSQNPHSGSHAVQLGSFDFGSTTFGDSAISQVLSVPAASGQMLSFWEWPLAFDSIFFDQQYVRVTPLDPSGPTVTLMSELRSDQTYILRQFSLDAFAGQTVRLTFGVHQDSSVPSGMFIDDVSASAPQCGPPDFAVQLAPASSEICAGASFDYAVTVTSVNGPNFTSPVSLSVRGLPASVTASFADNPVAPGHTTTLTLRAARPAVGGIFPFTLAAVAVTPPPGGEKTVSASLTLDSNTPQAPQVISPVDGAVNLPLQPTLSWTAPFVPDVKAAAIIKPQFFGAAQYHLQIATDAAFTNVAVDTTVTDTTFTASSLAAATQYFWRVSATNACGTSPWSSVASFIVGACAEGWSARAPIPDPQGGLQDGAAVAVPGAGKIYVIGGTARFSGGVSRTWAYDPSANAWTQKSDVPFPGVGTTYGSAAIVGGTIYVFGGISPFGGSSQALWKYDVANDVWSQGANLPTFSVGSAVAAWGGKIYIAYGSGFGNQTWEYDPSTDGYTRKADAPQLPAEEQLHGVTLGGDIHVFGGGFHGSSHVVYTPATDRWTTAPSMPFGVTNPAVGDLGGKAIVAGGQPTAWTQIFDPATGTWTQSSPIAGEPNGLDSSMGATLNGSFYSIGGNDTSGPVANQWQFHPCNLGNLSSATLLPLVVDGDGHVSGVSNERTTLFLANTVSGEPLTATCFLYGMNGAVLGRASFAAAPNEVRSVTDVVRVLKNATTVQNVAGSLAIFGTGLFEASASIVSNVTSDSAFEEGQSMAGRLTGFLPAIEEGTHSTQVVFSNISANTAMLQLLAYPAQGGQTPAAATLTLLAGHNSVSYADIVQQLALPKNFLGQLQFSSNQPVAAVARAVVPKHGYSGFEPVRSVADASPSTYVPYAEDSTTFRTSLLLSNPTLTPADVTVTLVDEADTTGATSGTASSRDLPLGPNAVASIADVVRWVLRQASTVPSGKHGFLVVSTPQAVTAQAKIVDSANSDPAIPGLATAVTSAFSPFLIRLEPIPFIVARDVSGAAPTGGLSATALSRFAVSNPGSSPATVELAAVSATGGPETRPLVVTLAPNGQLLTEDLVTQMELPPIFLGSLVVRSDAPVLVYNHRRSGETGDVVPVVPR